MKQSDFDNPIQMRQHCQDIYEKLRHARKQFLRVDIAPGKANHVQYKAAVQWLNSALDELTFEEKEQ